ncbi:toxic anion resistance protein [[Clostridium] colinum]|uniref:toxic anion resistance protein n=1 Tax=[Clostridium] colinum TaxID=36835 RepID=UPI0020252E71|nr:toxic anion resistance protein [[Clostridium] colinum]
MDELEKINMQDIKPLDDRKEQLKQLPQVISLSNSIDFKNPTEISKYGFEPSQNLSKINDIILEDIKKVKTEEVGEMLVKLTNIMKSFDLQEIKNYNFKEKKTFLDKIKEKFNSVKEDIYEKYNSLSKQIEGVGTLLNKYSSDIATSNKMLQAQFEATREYMGELEYYIVAGEMALQRIEEEKIKLATDINISSQDRIALESQLNLAQDLLSQRILDLSVSQNVAMQIIPMINMMITTNSNLNIKIDSAFITTLPIFKVSIINAITLRRQAIQNQAISQAEDFTKQLFEKTVQQTVDNTKNVKKSVSSPVISIETLEKTYNTILTGINEVKQIDEQNKEERMQNIKKLEDLKLKMLNSK